MIMCLGPALALFPGALSEEEKGPDTHCMHIFKFASIFSPDTFATMLLSGYGQITCMYNLQCIS